MALNRISEEVIEIRVDGAKEAEQEIDGLSKGLRDVEQSSKKADKSTAQASQGFSKLQASITTAGAAVAGFQAAMAAAGAAMSAIKAPVNLAIEFETQFNQIKTLNSEIGDDLRNKLLDLAKRVPQTAGDITSAAYQAISAGIDPGQVTDFLEAASKSAIASGGSLTESVELLTAGVNAFGRQGETASSVADKLFATVKRGVTTIPELNAVFGRAAATASSYGIGLGEVLGAIATLTKQGLPTAEAMTRVTATIKELSRAGGTAAKALKKQGVQVGVLALQQKGLVGVLEDVNKATGGQADQLAKLSSRAEAVGGILGLTGRNMEDFRGTVQGVNTDLGASGEAYDIVSQGTQGTIDSFNSLKEGVMRELGEQTLPALNELLKSLSVAMNGSSNAAKAFGKGLASIIKIGTLVVKNIDMIAASMSVAFTAKYLPVFIAQLGKMRASFMAFNAMISASGAATGASYGRLLVGGIAKVLSGPMLAGAVALAVAGAVGLAMEGAEEKAREVREAQRKEAAQDLKDFLASEGIRGDAIEKRLKGEARLVAAEQLRVKAAREANKGNRELADGLIDLTQKIDDNKTGALALNDLFLASPEAAKALIKTLNIQSLSYADLVKSQDDAVSSAKGLEQQNAALIIGQSKLEEARRTANAELQENQSILADFQNNAEATQEKFGKLQKRLDAFSIEAIRGAPEAFEQLKNDLAETEKQVKENNAGMDIFSEKIRDNIQAIDESGDAIEQNKESYKVNADQIAVATKHYEENQAAIDKTVTALDREIAKLKDTAKARKEEAAGNRAFIAAIEKALGIEIKQAQARSKAKEAQKKAAEDFYKRSTKALQQAERTAEKLNINKLKREEKSIESFNEIAIQEVENLRTISLARLEARDDLDELVKLEKQRLINSEADLKVSTMKIAKEIDLAAARRRTAEAVKAGRVADINAQKVSKTAKSAQIAQEHEKTRVVMDGIDAREKAATTAVARQSAQAQQVAAIEAPAEDTAAGEPGKARAQEKRRFDLEMMREDSQERFALESELRIEEQSARIEQMKLGADEEGRLKQQVADREIEIAEQRAAEIANINSRQQAAAADAISNTFGELAHLSEAAGASDSFVGKIEAAQILAKGVYHGFQGASDQADALTAFSTPGAQAIGIAKQAAAIAHFAQAAAAPMMAAKAFGGGGGGSGGGGGGMSGGAVSGPRRTSEGSTRERQEQRATIQFGDIVLSDVPALLSRQGTRALGQQIAGDVAREINRSRSLPGGFRV